MRQIARNGLWLISAALTFAQVRDVYYQADLKPLNTTPTFDRGYLVVYDRNHRVDVFGPDGALKYSAAAQAPGAEWVGIENGAVDADGTLALAVQPVSEPYTDRGGIALFDRTGTQIGFIDTGDYLPTQVAFGSDHSIWTTGWLGYRTATITADYATLRNYSQDGRHLGAFLPRSVFPYPQDSRREPLIAPFLGLWELRVVNDRVEVMLQRQDLWVETDLNGQERGRWDITWPNNSRPAAFTQDGRAWRKDGPQIQIFDLTTGVWRVASSDAPEGTLLGAEGNSLVFMLRDRRTVRWMPAPGSPVDKLARKIGGDS